MLSHLWPTCVSLRLRNFLIKGKFCTKFWRNTPIMYGYTFPIARLKVGLQMLKLLHPQGVLEIIDLLVTQISDYHHVPPRQSGKTGRPLYRSGFKGPAKYEGSAVDWINARLLRAMSERLFPNTVTTFTSLEQFDPAKKHMSIMELCPNSVQMDGTTN